VVVELEQPVLESAREVRLPGYAPELTAEEVMAWVLDDPRRLAA
jgi:hypothetical protein